jgi:hypothetical protein
VLSQLQNPIIYILLFAVAVAVAAVPEGLPAVLTITAPGMRTMLGLVPLDGVVLGLVAAALGVTVVREEIWSRRVISQRPSREVPLHALRISQCDHTPAGAPHRS